MDRAGGLEPRSTWCRWTAAPQPSPRDHLPAVCSQLVNEPTGATSGPRAVCVEASRAGEAPGVSPCPRPAVRDLLERRRRGHWFDPSIAHQPNGLVRGCGVGGRRAAARPARGTTPGRRPRRRAHRRRHPGRHPRGSARSLSLVARPGGAVDQSLSNCYATALSRHFRVFGAACRPQGQPWMESRGWVPRGPGGSSVDHLGRLTVLWPTPSATVAMLTRGLRGVDTGPFGRHAMDTEGGSAEHPGGPIRSHDGE